MAFSYNPFRHIEVIHDGELWYAFCHSCGAVLKGHGMATPLAVFISNTQAHVASSHELTLEDFQEWSTF